MSEPLAPPTTEPAQLVAAIEAIEHSGLDAISLDQATAVLAAAVRLATAKSEQSDELIELSDSEVSATQAVTVASALLHAQHLNAFDLELWSAGKYATH